MKNFIKILPKKYLKIWKKCLPFLKEGRPDDQRHAEELVQYLINYASGLKLDLNILIPTAMMHDIGHAAILPEHFKYITGENKILNAKLVHMLAGAKIAKEILIRTKYNKHEIKEIVEIIAAHDADQLSGVNIKKIYNTKNKKNFHDIDMLDRYEPARIKNFLKFYKNKEKLIRALRESLNSFFFAEFSSIARAKLSRLI